jgi:cysteine desulfurase
VVTYLDHAATTPMRPEAVEAVAPFLGGRFGNPSGGHAVARAARRALEEARDEVAACLGRPPREVVFTIGGTEADHLAVAGVLAARGGRAVCSGVEHPAVLRAVEAAGGGVARVGPDGRVDLDDLTRSLDADVTLVSVMLANNEVGTIQPLDEVAGVVAARAPGAVLHTDAVQGAVWLDVATAAGAADLVAVSGHKLGGPQGVGALAVREGTPLRAQLPGGGQERERRSGTPNVAGAVGLAAALRATTDSRETTAARVRALRDRLADGLVKTVPGCRESCPRDVTVPGICSMLFEGVESEALLVLLDRAGVCATAASSCASGALEPSHVLTAMGVGRELARGSLRLSLGWCSTDSDVDAALAVVPEAVQQLRSRAGTLVLR